jgi:hypothetical protein
MAHSRTHSLTSDLQKLALNIDLSARASHSCVCDYATIS